MEKGNKKKREIQNALKILAIDKGYANVTMKDIGEYVGLSVGGLYHHYHSVEEIFYDLLMAETGDVWSHFSEINTLDELINTLNVYFEAEKSELLGEVPSLNTLMYQFYFSHPESERIRIMKQTNDEMIMSMVKILIPVFRSRKLCNEIALHICVVMQGLVDLSFSGSITRSVVDDEFGMLREYLTNKFETKGE